MVPHNDHLASALLGLAAEFLARQPTGHGLSGGQNISTPFSTTSQSDWAEAVQHWNQNGRHLIADLPDRHCPACEHGEHRHLFQSYDGYPCVECLSCGCWSVPLKVEAELFERFFAHCPQAFEVVQRNLQNRQTEASKQSSLDRIGEYLDTLVPMLKSGDSLRYLDMGCGLGQSLLAARARGLQATGVESSRECIALAVQEGLEVIHASEDGLEGRQFHLISFWESLEHMVDPAAVLKDCATHLAPGGLLAFTVPNQNSPLVRSQREDCSFVNGGYDTPGHINLFNPATIERLLDRSGYSLLALDGQYGLDLSELVSYLLGKQRSAYTLLKGESVHNDLSEESNATLRAIGPAFAVLERLALITPIMFGFACRKKDTQIFSQLIADYRESRRERMLVQIRTLEPVPSDIAVLQQKWYAAVERINELEDQLRVARNPLRRLVRFVRSKLNTPKG
jgi:SAM-dependent methyltransferase